MRLLQQLASQDEERAPATRQPRPSPAVGIEAREPNRTASPSNREPHPAQRKGTANRELIVILALAVVSFVLAVSLELFETLHELARRWNAEEVFVIAIVLAIAFGSFYFLRWRELHTKIQQREQAHQVLRESEQRLQLIARASNDALWDWDIAGGQVWLDEGYRTLFGHRVADNIVNVSWWSEKIHAEDRQRVLEGIEQVFGRGEHFWTGEYRFLHANGSYVDVLDRGYVHYDQEGKPVRMVGAMMDLAERKRAEEALRASEERFRQLAETIREVFWMAEPTDAPALRVLYVSPAYEEVWGRSRQSLYDKPLSFVEAIHPDDRQLIQTAVASHEISQQGVEYRIVRPDSSIRWIWNRTFPIFDAQGKLYRLVGIAQDITERKHAEEALRESERHFHTLAEIVPVGIFRADAAGKCLFVNQRACQLVGLSREEQQGYCWQRALHPDDRERVLAEWTKAAQRKEPFQCEYRFLHHDGTIRWVLGQALAERDETGRIVGYVGSLTDITEQRQAQLRLAESERLAALGCMIAGIAHELNNPLQVILGFSELLRQNPNLDATPRHQAEIIQNQSARARKIISNLLTFGRQNALEPTPVNINELLQKLLELRGYALHLDGIQLETEFQSLPLILADPNRLQQVFLNLFLNAEQALTQATGERKIALRTRLDPTPEGEQIRVTLSDTGVGIPGEHLPRVFDPFFTTKPPGEGTGLGLSIAYSIVREHGGSIELASEAGLGTTVTVSLPVVPTEPAGNPKPEPPPPPSLPPACEQRPRSALVVDDEEAIREFLQESLGLEGFEVDVAENAEEGLARLRARHYDLVLCDIKMPGKTGIELLEEISREQPDIVPRFIFMTGDALSPGTREVLDSAVVRYLMKPFTLADILRLLSEPS